MGFFRGKQLVSGLGIWKKKNSMLKYLNHISKSDPTHQNSPPKKHQYLAQASVTRFPASRCGRCNKTFSIKYHTVFPNKPRNMPPQNTPWKINMEPENDGLEDVSPFQLGDFLVPC